MAAITEQERAQAAIESQQRRLRIEQARQRCKTPEAETRLAPYTHPELRTCRACSESFSPGDSAQTICSVACMATEGHETAIRAMAGQPFQAEYRAGLPTAMFLAAEGIDPAKVTHRALLDRSLSPGRVRGKPTGPGLVERVRRGLDGYKRCAEPGCKITFRDRANPDRRTCGGDHDQPRLRARKATPAPTRATTTTTTRGDDMGYDPEFEAFMAEGRRLRLATARELNARMRDKIRSDHFQDAIVEGTSAIQRGKAVDVEVAQLRASFGVPYPGTARRAEYDRRVAEIYAKYGYGS